MKPSPLGILDRTVNWPRVSDRILSQCRSDPFFFSRHVLGGEQPWPRQAEILLALRDSHRVAVRSGHGVGKTWTAARAAIWFLYAHPHSIVLTTAPTHRQVRSILWAEIRRQVRRSLVPLGGKVTETRLSLDDDWFALGLSTDEPDRFQGYHAEHLLIIFDEAPGVPAEIYEAARGLLTSRHARMLLIGNPTVSSGPFYEAFRNPQWKTLHIPCTECPNVRQGRILYPKLVTRAWIEAQREEWGADSAAFCSRVMGEFPEDDAACLIPLARIHAAQRRGDERLPPIRGLRMGVDVARFGSDHTAFVLVDDFAVRAVQQASGISTMETVGRILALARSHCISAERIAVDDTGVGGGVVDRLREQDWSVSAFRAAARPCSGHFANRRAELYWNLRCRLASDSPMPLAIPRRMKRLCRELSAISYGFDSRGLIRIDGKDLLRSRLGTSPDHADALAIALDTLSQAPSSPRAWEL